MPNRKPVAAANRPQPSTSHTAQTANLEKARQAKLALAASRAAGTELSFPQQITALCRTANDLGSQAYAEGVRAYVAQDRMGIAHDIGTLQNICQDLQRAYETQRGNTTGAQTTGGSSWPQGQTASVGVQGGMRTMASGGGNQG